MHKRIALSLCLVVASTIASSQAILAKPIPSFIKKDGFYPPYRARLNKGGWKVHGTSLREDGSCDARYDERCAQFPEAQTCSGTGLGYCNMIWRHTDGTVITILTAGDGDGSPAVVSVTKN